MPRSMAQTLDQFLVGPFIDRKSFQQRTLYIEFHDFQCCPGSGTHGRPRSGSAFRSRLRPEFTMRVSVSQGVPNHSDCAVSIFCLYWSPMDSAASLLKRSLRILGRVFPRCTMLSQAIAFNLFLAFFPTLLLAVAIATSRLGSHTDLLDLITNFTRYLPPASRQ